MSDIVVKAIDFMEESESVVKSAERLGAAVMESLESGEGVIVLLSGLRGISSSYLNVLLAAVADRYGVDALDSRLKFQFDSMAQELVLQRSLQSVRQQYEAA